jgi:NAD(P)-dependent dehydrogenase (short-subunit alcohol dehydrogenase family)
MNAWRDKVVVVTGGSSGLGRAIAAAFGRAGAKVVVAARGSEALTRTADELRAQGIEIGAIPADVTRQESVDALFHATLERYGRLDVLVNNAGRSMRSLAADTTAEDFESLMELNLLGLVRCTRAALPHLLASRGHLVNISSLAGKAAARYMGAYPATKSAVTAYTQQLRLELADEGLHVLLVCPGPIARGGAPSPAVEQARPGDLARMPQSAREPGAGVKTDLIDPDKLAAAIVRACERRKVELVYPRYARLLLAVMQLSPTLGDWIVRRVA